MKKKGTLDDMSTWLWLGLAFGSAWVIQIGFILQKQSQIQTETNPKSTGIKTPRWWLGMLFIGFGSMMNMGALIYLDLVLLSTVNAVQVLAAVILSTCWLGEKFVWCWDLPAIILIIGGSVSMVLCANQDPPGKVTYDTLKYNILSIQAMNYMIASLVGVVLSIVSYYILVVALVKMENHMWIYIQKINDLRHSVYDEVYGIQNVADSFDDRILPTQYGDVNSDEEEEEQNNDAYNFEQMRQSFVEDQDKIQQRTKEQQFKWFGFKPYMPTRLILQLIAVIPKYMLLEISPKQTQLKTFSKFPLMILTSSAGLMTGVHLVLFKISGTAIKEEVTWYQPFVLSCIAGGLVSAVFVIALMNQAMKLYNQMDVMLIFKAMEVCLQICAGLMLLDELAYYDWVGLARIGGSALLMLLGVLVLLLKHNFLRSIALKKMLGCDKDQELTDRIYQDLISDYLKK